MTSAIRWTQQELWDHVWLRRVRFGLSVEDVAREAKLNPEMLIRFENEGGTGPALRRVKYAIERLAKRASDQRGSGE
jgi:hypothetical protein